MKIKIIELENILRSALSIQYKHDEVELMIPVVMYGELTNRKSHGLMRVVTGDVSILAQNPTGSPIAIKKSNISKIIDGKKNHGMLVGALAGKEVVKIAKKFGIGIVGTNNSFGSSGSLGYYAEKIARENLIGIIMARAPGDVAPPGGVERLLGTNPVAFGIPCKKQPLIFDMATSAISYGAVLRARNMGEKIPENVALDSGGEPTTDPVEALKGVFLPFGGSYKGFGLGMMVEILAGILPGADFLDLNQKDGWGNLFIAIKPDILMNERVFKRKVNILVEKIRNSKTINNKPVRIAGENSREIRAKNIKAGYVEVDEVLLNKLISFTNKGELTNS
jgi:L-2-hydroxycarboxylate dehydrogenase (NAD+)